jgi:EmrB/QacA subfamily drug resistance transporter
MSATSEAPAGGQAEPDAVRTGAPRPPSGAVPAAVWRIAAIVIIGAFMTQLDTALVNIGLATVARDLAAPLQTTQWIVSGYLLALGIGLPLSGWSCRRIGAWRTWLWALLAFTVTSVLCAWSPSVQVLIAARVLQGIAGGLLLPAGQTIIAGAAGRSAMGRVMATVGTVLVIAPLVGPSVGGLVIAHVSWRWLFVVNAPVGALGLWLGLRAMPTGGSGAASRFDVLGFVLIGLGIPVATYSVSEAGQSSGLGLVLVPLAVGLLALVAFVVRCLRTSAPLLDVRLFANPVFAAAAASTALTGAVQFGALVIWPLYFQVIRGYDPVSTGLAVAGFAIGAATLPVSGRLTDRFGGASVCLGGAIITAAAFLPAPFLPEGTPLIALEALLVGFGIGNALSVVPGWTAAFVSVAREAVPDAVTLMNILLRIGGAIGASLLVALVSGHHVSEPVISRFHLAFWGLIAFALSSIVASAVLWAVSIPKRRLPG